MSHIAIVVILCLLFLLLGWEASYNFYHWECEILKEEISQLEEELSGRVDI